MTKRLRFRPLTRPMPMVLLALLILPMTGLGWGPEIHRVVGQLALAQVEPGVSAKLSKLTGDVDLEALVNACNWPDEFRATPEGAWTAPQHYINVPPEAASYDPDRDCQAKACVAGAIDQYAKDLVDTESTAEQRWRAWARICHFTGDIHQPLHVGYKHDRGGNDVQVVFRGQTMTLHRFWDHALFAANYPDWQLLVSDLEFAMEPPPTEDGIATDVEDWADESHRLARNFAYPPDQEISREFAAAAWLITLERIEMASQRLAQLLNRVLKDSGRHQD